MTMSSVDELRQREAAGVALRFLFFWGHRPQADGSVGTGCLSQWWPAEFTVDGVSYPTAEHYMMAEKARLFGDDEALSRVLVTEKPGTAKAIGRRVRGFDETKWTVHRGDIVIAANLAKFGQHDDLRAFLLTTGGRILVEASPMDRVWGIGLAATDPRAARPSQWPGLNLLGFALMRVRDELRGQS